MEAATDQNSEDWAATYEVDFVNGIDIPLPRLTQKVEATAQHDLRLRGFLLNDEKLFIYYAFCSVDLSEAFGHYDTLKRSILGNFAFLGAIIGHSCIIPPKTYHLQPEPCTTRIIPYQSLRRGTNT